MKSTTASDVLAPEGTAAIVHLASAEDGAGADPEQRARAFAEPLLTAQVLDTGEDALGHADGSAQVLRSIGAGPALCAAAYLVYAGDYLQRPDFNGVRLAKEFVKFSERCFIRLLGDMRSYNYVVDMTPDFEEVQYRVRAIDFDQQSYEGRKSLYLPQFFKENNPVVQLCSSCLNDPTMKQYQEEERSLISRRYLSESQRITALLHCMKNNAVEPFEKVVQLRAELGQYHSSHLFDSCKSMGEIVERNLDLMLGRHLE